MGLGVGVSINILHFKLQNGFILKKNYLIFFSSNAYVMHKHCTKVGNKLIRKPATSLSNSQCQGQIFQNNTLHCDCHCADVDTRTDSHSHMVIVFLVLDLYQV